MLSTTGKTDIIFLLNQIESWRMRFFIPPTSLQVAKNIAKQGEIGGMRRKSKAVFWYRLKLDNFGVCRTLRISPGQKSPKLYNSGWILPERGNDLKSLALKSVPVRVRLPAPNQYNPNQIFPVGDGFGFVVFFSKFEDTHFRNGVIKQPESKPRGPRKRKQI